MTEVLPSPVAVSAFLLTYLLHSTLAVLLACAILRHCRIGMPDVRLFLWKMTLTVPIATSLAVTTLELPHVGVQWVIAETEAEQPKAGGQAVEKQAYRAAAPFGEAGIHSEHRSELDRSTAPFAQSAVLSPSLLNQSIWPLVSIAWLAGILIGSAGLCVQLLRLHRCRRSGMVVTEPEMLRTLGRLVRKTNVRRPIDLLESSDGVGPLTAGFRRPFILIPRAFLRSLTRPESDALLAHELAHVVNRDAWWNLIGDSICRFLFFQPLNRLARRQLRIEMEFAADCRAVQMLKRRSGLARCLTRLGEWVNASSQETAVPPKLAAGMASFRSVLGRRVETLLVDKELKNSTPTMRFTVMTLVIAASFATVAVVPRAAAHVPPQTTSEEGNKPMLRPITMLAMLAGLTLPAAADDETRPQEASSKTTELKTSPDPLPDGIKDFNGMLVGRLAKKDIEKGTFVVRVDAVPRVWRNSKAENPKSIVGKNVEVEGVFGKWLDVLLVVREGETLEFEAKHDGGDQLTFPGELLRKAAPYKAEDYPELPERFRGFRGAVTAAVVKKDPETFELIVEVDRVIDVWKASKAEEPKSIEGKQMMVAGFWQRKDAYHNLKVGDRIEVGLQHIEQRSDHMTVAEFVRKTEGGSPASTDKKRD